LGFIVRDAIRIAERIRGAVEKAAIPNAATSWRGAVTASFGVASTVISDLTAMELIAAADSALYAAKRNGRNRVWPPFAALSDDLNIDQAERA
jgi:diguanylate cyclase (GGDEF)-like protein